MTNDFNFVKCPKCEHDRNPITATKCEICGTPLKRSASKLPLILGAVWLLAALGAGIFFLKDKVLKTPNGSASAPSSSGLSASGAPSSAPSAVQNEQKQNGQVQNGQVQGAIVKTYPKFSDVPGVPQGIFSYGGSTTFAPLRSPQQVGTLTQAFPQFQLRYTEPPTGSPGSGQGIQQLLDGQMSFSQSSRPVKDTEYATAKNRGFTLDAVPVAIDGIAFFVNPQLIDAGVKGLTLSQLRDIFTGKIQNWKALGGPNQAIKPFSRNLKSGGTVDFFSENVLDKQPLGSDVGEVRDTTEAIRKVAQNPGGISYASTSESIKQQTIRLLSLAKSGSQTFVSPCGDIACISVDSKAFVDSSYPLTRRLFVIVKRDGKLDEQAGVAYANLLLSDEGQAMIKQAGFVSIR
jgi:phosphate transport system substrate-binding protein